MKIFNNLGKYLWQMVVKTVFKDGQLDVNETSFNPLRLILTLILVLYLSFTSLYLYKATRLHNRLEKLCPSIISVVDSSIKTEVFESINSEREIEGELILCKIQVIKDIDQEETK